MCLAGIICMLVTNCVYGISKPSLLMSSYIVVILDDYIHVHVYICTSFNAPSLPSAAQQLSYSCILIYTYIVHVLSYIVPTVFLHVFFPSTSKHLGGNRTGSYAILLSQHTEVLIQWRSAIHILHGIIETEYHLTT